MPQGLCAIHGCTKWQFKGGFCRDHQAWCGFDIWKDPLVPGPLNVLRDASLENVSYMKLIPGTSSVEILDLLDDEHTCVCRAVDPTTGTPGVGYYPVAYLASADQAQAQGPGLDQQQQEAERIAKEKRIAEQKSAEADYERELKAKRDKMFLEQEVRFREEKQRKLAAIEDDKRRREEEARLAKEEEARVELERQRRDAEERARQAERRAQLTEEARYEREAREATRIEEERKKALLDKEHDAKQDQKYLESLPSWKADLIVKRREKSKKMSEQEVTWMKRMSLLASKIDEHGNIVQ